MTCIVGLVDEGIVYMGGDSAGVGDFDLTQRADTKVFKNGEFLMGFTSSFRMGQLLRYKFTPPPYKNSIDVHKYMATVFIDAVRECLKDGGYARNVDGEEKGGRFLVGFRGRLFVVYEDFQVSESVHSFDAVGCGDQIARGSLFTSGRLADASPHERIRDALQASETFSAGVRSPFLILDTREDAN